MLNALLDAEDSRDDTEENAALRDRLAPNLGSHEIVSWAHGELREIESWAASLYEPPPDRELRDLARRALEAAAESVAATDPGVADRVRDTAGGLRLADRGSAGDTRSDATPGSDVAPDVSPGRPIESGQRAGQRTSSWRRSWSRIVGLAAAVAIDGALVILMLDPLRRDSGYDFGPQRTMAQTWAHAVDRSFEPEWLCENGRELYRQFHIRFGDWLVLANDRPNNVGMAGLGYARAEQ